MSHLIEAAAFLSIRRLKTAWLLSWNKIIKRKMLFILHFSMSFSPHNFWSSPFFRKAFIKSKSYSDHFHDYMYVYRNKRLLMVYILLPIIF